MYSVPAYLCIHPSIRPSIRLSIHPYQSDEKHKLCSLISCGTGIHSPVAVCLTFAGRAPEIRADVKILRMSSLLVGRKKGARNVFSIKTNGNEILKRNMVITKAAKRNWLVTNEQEWKLFLHISGVVKHRVPLLQRSHYNAKILYRWLNQIILVHIQKKCHQRKMTEGKLCCNFLFAPSGNAMHLSEALILGNCAYMPNIGHTYLQKISQYSCCVIVFTSLLLGQDKKFDQLLFWASPAEPLSNF